MDNALDQALNTVKNTLGGAGNFLGQLGQSAGSELSTDASGFSQGVQNFTKQAQQYLSPSYYNPASDAGNNFWSSPMAQGLGNLQPHAENLLQGASLGYYQPPQQDQQNMNPVVGGVERLAGGAVPFMTATALTGGAADLALGEGALTGIGRSIATTAGGGALTGLTAPAQNPQQRLTNTLSGGVTGGGFGALGVLGENPLVQSAVGSMSMAALTALQGGNRDQVLASAIAGAGTPLFFKGTEMLGGGEAAQNLMQKLWDNHGTDSYRFMANKDLIQRVVTGQGSPEDIFQFNILNRMGVTAQAARSTEGISIEDQQTRVPKTGPVWDFLKTVFPSSFKGNIPESGFTDPQTTPLAAIPEMALDPNENDALQKIDENNPDPSQKQPMGTQEALQQKLAEQGGQVPNAATGEQVPPEQAIQQGQELTTPEGQGKLADIYQNALNNRPILDNFLDKVGQQTGGNVVSNLKNPDTAVDKTVEKRVTQPDRGYGLNDVNDIVRGRIVYNNPQQIQQGVANLVKQIGQYNAANPDAQVKIAKEENFFTHPRDLYQGYHVDLQFPNGQHSEIQFHTWKTYAAALATHPLHEIYGNQDLPPDALAQKQQTTNSINQLTDENAQTFAKTLEQQGTPKQQETAQNVQQTVEQQPVNDLKETIIEAFMANDPQAAAALHQANSQDFSLPPLDALQQEAESRMTGIQQQEQEGYTDMVSNSMMKHPEVAQHKDTIRKAVKIYNLVKSKGQDDIATISTKVKGLDVALQSMREKGIDVQDMNHLSLLAKELPKKTDVSVRAPKTSAELMANKVATQKGMAVKNQPQINGVKFTEDALPEIAQRVKDVQTNQAQLDQPGYFAQNILPDTSWENFLKSNPEINNHNGGSEVLKNARGHFAWIDPKAIIPDQNRLDITIDKRVADQFGKNEPVIIKANGDGTFKKIDGQHRLLASQAFGNPRLPAIILDDKSSTLAYAYDQVKNGQPVPFIQGKGIPVKSQQPVAAKVAPDFEKEMDALSQQGGSSKFLAANQLSPEESKQQMRNVVGAGQTAQGGTPPPNTPPTGPADFARQPINGYVKELQPYLNRIAQGGLTNYPIGRDFTKILNGRKATNENLGMGVANWVSKILPDAKDRETVTLALDGSIPTNTLTPQQKLVYEQVGGLEELVGLRRKEMYPTFKMIEQHITRNPITKPTDIEKGLSGTPGVLSENAREMFHRNIWKFVPTDGKGKGFIASTAAPNFKLTRSPDNPTVWQDAKGRQYNMQHAPIPEIEKAMPGVKYEKDLANISGKSTTDFLNQKDHHFAVKAVQDGIFNGEAIAPGGSAPGNYRYVDVKGLEGWKFSPKVATSLENLSRDPNVPKWEQGYNKAENFVTNLVFYNALKHPFNMANLALGFSGQYRSGNPLLDTLLPGPQGMVKYASLLPTGNAISHSQGDVYYAMKDAGSTIGDFNRAPNKQFIRPQQQGVIKQGLSAVGKYNPGALFYKGNKAIVGHVDDVFRATSTLLHYETIHGSPLTTDGTTLAKDFDASHLQQAVSQADKDLVDYGNVSRGEKKFQRLGAMFYPWVKGLLGNLGRMGKNPWEYRGAIQNFIMMGLAAWGASQLWKKYSGNQDAYVEQYGLNNFANQLASAGPELYNDYQNPLNARIPTILSSHIGRPILKEIAQQAFNSDLFTGKPIFDPNKIVSESQLGQQQPGQGALRLEHAVQGLAAPLQPLLKTNVITNALQNYGIPVKSGNQTPLEAVTSNYLGFKTPHTAGHSAAPAIQSGPLANLNLPNAQPTTGIASINYRDQLNASLDAGTRAGLQQVSQLNSKSYAEGNPVYKMQAYGLLVTNPALQEAQSKMEVGTAQAEGKAVNPLWALGLTDPQAQKTVLQYKSLLPADQQNFKKDPQNAAVINSYNAAVADYYAKLPQNPTVQVAQKAGFQPPVESPDVKTLLAQAKATKNYSLYDDPRVQAYFNQYDQYDNYINGQFGLPPIASTSGTGSKYSSYSSTPGGSYGAAGTAAYMDRALERQYMYAALRNSMTMPNVTLTLPKPAVKPIGEASAQLAQKQQPVRVTLGGVKLGSNGQVPLPAMKRIQITQPKYQPLRLSKNNIQTIM